MALNKKYLVVVLGPTAVGKTALSINLAKAFDTEIISADSRQFYREMTIGTAKPTADELAEVKHHFIDILSVTESYSAGQFEADVLQKLDELFLQSDVVLMTGGSGLFIKAVVEGLDAFPDIDPQVRKNLQQLYDKEGLESLQAMLQEKDPVYYEEVDRNNPQRLMRALEVAIGTGKPYSSFRRGNTFFRKFEVIKVGVKLPREQLYKRINNRVDDMMGRGLLNEVKSLVPYKHLNALETVGYKELFGYLEKKLTKDEAVELVKRNTRRFAKRQMTWFRKEEDVHWFNPGEATDVLNFIRSQVEESM